MADYNRLIEVEREDMENGDRFSAPKIVQRLTNRTDAFYEHERDNLLVVVGTGWDKLVRDAIKNPSRGPDDEQLSLWPVQLREHVQRVGSKAVFVPSRGRFVPLIPGLISRDEVHEAAKFMRLKGRETLARSRALMRLHEAMPRTFH